MIAYFSQSGRLLELVTDYVLVDAEGNELFRSFASNEGNDGTNDIFCYFDGMPSVGSADAFVQYRKPDRTLTIMTAADGETDAFIKFNPKKDLSFFKYGKEYKLIRFSVPSPDVIDNPGVYSASVAVIGSTGTSKVFDPIAFNVASSAVSVGDSIKQSQFDYLLAKLAAGGPRGASIWAGSAFTSTMFPGGNAAVAYTAYLPTAPTEDDLAFLYYVDPTVGASGFSYKAGDICTIKAVTSHRESDGTRYYLLLGEVLCNVTGAQGASLWVGTYMGLTTKFRVNAMGMGSVPSEGDGLFVPGGPVNLVGNVYKITSASESFAGVYDCSVGDPIGNIRGPQGNKGNTGAQGPQGASVSNVAIREVQ